MSRSRFAVEQLSDQPVTQLFHYSSPLFEFKTNNAVKSNDGTSRQAIIFMSEDCMVRGWVDAKHYDTKICLQIHNSAKPEVHLKKTITDDDLDKAHIQRDTTSYHMFDGMELHAVSHDLFICHIPRMQTLFLDKQLNIRHKIPAFEGFMKINPILIDDKTMAILRLSEKKALVQTSIDLQKYTVLVDSNSPQPFWNKVFDYTPVRFCQLAANQFAVVSQYSPGVIFLDWHAEQKHFNYKKVQNESLIHACDICLLDRDRFAIVSDHITSTLAIVSKESEEIQQNLALDGRYDRLIFLPDKHVIVCYRENKLCLAGYHPNITLVDTETWMQERVELPEAVKEMFFVNGKLRIQFINNEIVNVTIENRLRYGLEKSTVLAALRSTTSLLTEINSIIYEYAGLYKQTMASCYSPIKNVDAIKFVINQQTVVGSTMEVSYDEKTAHAIYPGKINSFYVEKANRAVMSPKSSTVVCYQACAHLSPTITLMDLQTKKSEEMTFESNVVGITLFMDGGMSVALQNLEVIHFKAQPVPALTLKDVAVKTPSVEPSSVRALVERKKREAELEQSSPSPDVPLSGYLIGCNLM